MSHFEVLYGRRCQTPVSWDNLADIIILGPDMLKEMETIVQKTKHNLKSAQDRHKSFFYLKRTHTKFNVGDHVYLKLKPRKRFIQIGKKF